MNTKQKLRDKLRKIEALAAGTTISGEKAAADAKAEHYRRLLKNAEPDEPPWLTPDHLRLQMQTLGAYAARCRNASGKKPRS